MKSLGILGITPATFRVLRYFQTGSLACLYLIGNASEWQSIHEVWSLNNDKYHGKKIYIDTRSMHATCAMNEKMHKFQMHP